LASPIAAQLSKPNQNSNSQQSDKPDDVGTSAQPQGQTAPSAVSASSAEDGKDGKKHHCEYSGPVWFSGTYCFFVIHEKFWVSFGTLVLAVSTGVLGFATIFLWRATRRLVLDAREAGAGQLAVNTAMADAALLNARSGIESERAYLAAILTHDGVGMYYGDDASKIPLETVGQFAQRAWVQFDMKNFGKTPAILKEFRHQLRHGSKDWPDFAPEHTPDLDDTKLPVVLGAGDSLPKK
jgi:hypothetical protein